MIKVNNRKKIEGPVYPLNVRIREDLAEAMIFQARKEGVALADIVRRILMSNVKLLPKTRRRAKAVAV